MSIYFRQRRISNDVPKNRCSLWFIVKSCVFSSAQKSFRTILSASRVAPSACNRQPQRIIVVREPENLLKIQNTYKTFGSPCVLIVCRDRRNELVRPFDNKCSGDLDIGIVCDHMMLETRELGLGSVMVGLFDPAIIRAVLLNICADDRQLDSYPTAGLCDSSLGTVLFAVYYKIACENKRSMIWCLQRWLVRRWKYNAQRYRSGIAGMTRKRVTASEPVFWKVLIL